MKEFDGFIEDRTKGLYLPKGMENVGQAYGVFDCKYEAEAVKEAINGGIRQYAKIPREVQLSLTEGTDNIGDAGISSLKNSSGENFRYVLEAMYRGTGNRDAASELRHAINQTYQSQLFLTPFHGQEYPFDGNIIYKKDGNYVSWD